MDQASWDADVQRFGGHLLQSWRWGESKQRQGWQVERLKRDTASFSWMAQILFKSHGPIRIAYLPNGPITYGDHIAAFHDLNREIDRVCRRARAISLVVEPTVLPHGAVLFAANGYAPRPRAIQPRKTFAILVDDDARMLKDMHHKTRYHIRLAERQGMVAEWRPADTASQEIFFELHADTVRRNGIAPLSRDYFRHVCAAFEDDIEIVLGVVAGMPVAAAMVVWFGAEAHYLFAGSSTAHRGQGAGAFVVYRALQRARAKGCERLDMGSIESDGLRTFKTGFHGVEREYLPPMEHSFQPAITWLMWRAISAKSAVSREAIGKRTAIWLHAARGLVGRPSMVR